MKNKVYIVGHSLSPQSAETITVLATFPRIILSEINTHRMLSKNTSSSRAIPFLKMVEAIQNNPFVPIAWQKYHPGMQGSEYLDETVKYDLISFMDILNDTLSNTEDEKERARLGKRIEEKTKIIKELLTPYTLLEKTLPEWWLFARDKAVEAASILYVFDVTKQLCNRLLEPFMWTTMLITGSKEGWENFFNLRCGNYDGFKSRKEASKEFLEKGNINTSTWSDMDWRKLNKGQAEIHMMALAECIYDAMNESTPKQLQAGEWHIPFEDKINIDGVQGIQFTLKDNSTKYVEAKWITEYKVKVSVGMAANTSYTVVGDGSIINLEKATTIHDKCKELNHSSVFEHCARAMSDDEYYTFVKGRIVEENKREDGTCDSLNWVEASGWCYNFKGFIPYRYMIDNNLIK